MSPRRWLGRTVCCSLLLAQLAWARDIPYNPPAPASDAASATGSAPAATSGSSAADARRDEEARRKEWLRLQSLDLGLAVLPPAQPYLDGLMARIQAAGPQPARYARVLVRPRLSYNAFSTASGHVVIDLGWLNSIDSEAELIALLAHEYGHIVYEHLGPKNQVGVATQTAIAAARVLTAKTGGSYVTTGLINDGWAGMLMPGWSRQQELEADRFSVEMGQALNQPFISGMRAFLERIRSVEQDAGRRAVATAGANATAGKGLQFQAPAAGTGSDDHPSIDERLEQAQSLVEGKPRIRAGKGPDPWRSLRDSAAYRQACEEYQLAAPLYEALRKGEGNELNALGQRTAPRLRTPHTAAGMTLMAVAQPRPEPGGSLSQLQAAMAAPDASFLPFLLMALTQRDGFKDYDGALKTMDAGMDRFEQPAALLPDLIEFQRVVLERINAIPSQQRGALGFLALKRQLNQITVQARCLTEPEFRDACAWAGLSEQQRVQKVQQDKAKQDALVHKLEQKIQKATR